MTEPAPIVEVTRLYGAGCEVFGSPFYAALLGHLAADLDAGGVAADFLADHATTRYEEAVPLRLLGGVHRHVLAGTAPALVAHFPSVGGDGDAGAAWPLVVDALTVHEEALRDILTRPPQTNDVGRSAALVGGLLTFGCEHRLPLRLLELGSSAALNLRLDRYWYQSEGAGTGDPESPVRFVDLWTGRPPLGAALEIGERRGCDRHPIDAATDDGRLTLLSYVWPDQLECFALLRAALDVARDFPVAIDRVDIPEWLTIQLREPIAGMATVVFHSIVWQYLSSADRASLKATLAAAGAEATSAAPLAWLRLEPGLDATHTELRLTTWPGARERHLATLRGSTSGR